MRINKKKREISLKSKFKDEINTVIFIKVKKQITHLDNINNDSVILRVYNSDVIPKIINKKYAIMILDLKISEGICDLLKIKKRIVTKLNSDKYNH